MHDFSCVCHVGELAGEQLDIKMCSGGNNELVSGEFGLHGGGAGEHQSLEWGWSVLWRCDILIASSAMVLKFRRDHEV
jgi:hypothetical protein